MTSQTQPSPNDSPVGEANVEVLEFSPLVLGDPQDPTANLLFIGVHEDRQRPI
ncbi:MAG: hypothetical protein ACRD29_03355 [Acidimicrobiales bacterium]